MRLCAKFQHEMTDSRLAAFLSAAWSFLGLFLISLCLVLYFVQTQVLSGPLLFLGLSVARQDLNS